MRKRRKTSIKPDYQAKDLKNPFFHRPSKRAGAIWLLLLGLIVLIALTWFLFFSKFFLVNKVDIFGLTRVDEGQIRVIVDEQLEQNKPFFLPQRNIFFFNKDELESSIMKNYNLAEINIKKSLPKTLRITLSERPYAFIFQDGRDYYYASRDAYIIQDKEVSEEDKLKYFTLENRSQIVRINSNLKLSLKDDYLDFVFKLNETLNYQDEIKPRKYIIEQELNSLVLECEDGPLVYFNLNRDPVEQFEDLSIVKKEKMGDNFNKIKYIDMRYGDLIYIN